VSTDRCRRAGSLVVRVSGRGSNLTAADRLLLTYCVLGSTQPPTLRGRLQEMNSSLGLGGEGLV